MLEFLWHKAEAIFEIWNLDRYDDSCDRMSEVAKNYLNDQFILDEM